MDLKLQIHYEYSVEIRIFSFSRVIFYYEEF